MNPAPEGRTNLAQRFQRWEAVSYLSKSRRDDRDFKRIFDSTPDFTREVLVAASDIQSSL